MSPKSDWTVETLRQHFAETNALRDRDIDHRLEAIALEVVTARAGIDRELLKLNELRRMVTDRDESFMPKAECRTRLESVEREIQESRNKGSGFSAGWGRLAALIALGVAIAAYLKH